MSRDDLADIVPSPKEARGFTTIWGIAHGIAWGLLLALFAFGVPRAESVFLDCGVDLPSVTVLVIRVSHLVGTWFYVFAALLVVLLNTAWFLLDELTRRGEARSSRAWSILMLVCPLLLIVLSLVALGLPLLITDFGLSG